MTDGLRSTFDAACERALAWRDGDDSTAVLSAVALAGALELTGALARTDRRTRERLLALGARVLLAMPAARAREGADDDEDVADARALSAMLARQGLRALRGEAVERARSDVSAPSERELVQLFSGRGEPLVLAEIAWRVRGSSQALSELRFLVRRAADRARLERDDAPVLRLAADDGAAMLDPSLGTPLSAIREGERVLVELVLFPGEPARIAAYASEALPVRIVGEGVVGEAARAGYAAARIVSGPEQGALALEITVGERRYHTALDVRGSRA